jgi:hypothetical protein
MRNAIWFCCLAVLLAAGSVRAGGPPPVKPEVAATDAWLALVDAGKYGESWDTAATYFRGVVARAHWIALLEGTRKPLGRLVSREVLDRKFTKTLPGAPDGKYWIMRFDTAFDAKRVAEETVTVVAETDGAWRVAGYFVK